MSHRMQGFCEIHTQDPTVPAFTLLPTLDSPAHAERCRRDLDTPSGTARLLDHCLRADIQFSRLAHSHTTPRPLLGVITGIFP
jgi:hypothetical protein